MQITPKYPNKKSWDTQKYFYLYHRKSPELFVFLRNFFNPSSGFREMCATATSGAQKWKNENTHWVIELTWAQTQPLRLWGQPLLRYSWLRGAWSMSRTCIIYNNSLFLTAKEQFNKGLSGCVCVQSWNYLLKVYQLIRAQFQINWPIKGQY